MAYVSPTIRASTTTFAQLQTGGLSKVLANQLTANAIIATPTTAATATATGGGASGGSLAAGTYYITYSWTNGIGETAANVTRSAQLTVSATNIPRITLPSLPTGAVAANIYLTAANGASGTEVLYKQGVTTTTYDCSLATYDNLLKTPPLTNTTALTNAQGRLLSPQQKQLQDTYDAANRLVSNYLSGTPMALADVTDAVAKYAAVFQCYATALNEIGVLLAANTGTLTTTTNAAGERVAVRTF